MVESLGNRDCETRFLRLPCFVGACKNSTPSQRTCEIMFFGSSKIGKGRAVAGSMKCGRAMLVRYKLVLASILGVILWVGFLRAADSPRAASPTAPPRAVLFVSGGGVSQYVDPRVKVELNHTGWQVGRCALPDLTWGALRKFNVVVLERMPQNVPQAGPAGGNWVGDTPLDQKAGLLYRFMRTGGGVLLLHDESYDEVYVTENRFLKPLGAKIINEQVTDPKHEWHQPNYLQYWFAWTNNITPHNPVTEGVRTLWYPEGWSQRHARYTCPVVANSYWTVLARGMVSAYSYRAAAGVKPRSETFRSAPPILVSRSYGTGRMVIFSSHSTFTLQSGYFTTWQGIVMARGAEKRPSQTGRMLFNALVWLAKPSLTSGQLGGYHQPPRPKIAAKPQAAPAYHPNPPPGYELGDTFKGLIGAHSDLSNGHGTVAQWAAAARAAGYDFLVFSEAFPPMTKQRWGLLRSQCQRASTAHFLCIPGIAYRDSLNDRYITVAFPQWPQAQWLTKSGHRIANTPGIYFGNNWAPLGVVDVMHNPVAPWFLKFYGDLAVDSYCFAGGRCQRADDARPTYLRLMGDQYNSVPIAYYDMHRPADIQAIARAHGYADYAWGGKLAHVANAFRQNWYAQPQHAYISQGPLLKSWWITNGSSDNGTPGHNRRPWRLHVDVRSALPLRRVTIYNGTKLFRRFVAAGHRFQRVITGLHDRQDFFVLTARDVHGRQLISPTLRTADSRQSIYMCTDMQNTLNGGVVRTRHGRWTFLGMMGNYVTGWDALNMGILAPGRDLMPQGLDYVVKGFNGGASQYLYTAQGNESAIARLDIAFASGDCNILNLDYNDHFAPYPLPGPTRLAVTHAQFVEFTPRIYSDNLMLVRRTTILKRALNPSPTPMPDLQMFNLGGSDTSFPKYAYLDAGGRLVKGVRPPGNAVIANDVAIPSGGYVAVYPDFYGSGGVFVLRSEMCLPGHRWRNQPLRLHLQGASITLGYQMPGKALPAGTQFRQDLLVMRAKFGDDHGRCFQQVRKDYGLEGPPAYRVKSRIGTVKDTRYTLDLQARHGAAVVTISRAPLPNDLPIRIYGLQNRWSAVRANLPKGVALWKADPGVLRWRPMGICQGVGYLDIDINQHARRLFIGHPLLCGQPELFLNLVSWSKLGLTAEVHNPSAKAVNTWVRINPALGSGRRRLLVPAESSLTALIPWRG